MSVFVSFFVATFLFVFVLLWWGKKRHPKFPPGKTGVPFLGILPMLTRQPCKLFKKWSLEKGWPVMSVRIMNTDIVLLNKFEVVHQAFVKQSAQFSGRPFINLLFQVGGRNGIISKDYDEGFKTHKHFSLRILRSFGFGRKCMEDVINDEADCLIAHLAEKCKGKDTVNIKESMLRATANIIAKLCVSKRMGYADHSYDHFFDNVTRLLGDRKDGDMVGLLSICNNLRFIPPFSGASQRYRERDLIVRDYARNWLEEHKKDFRPDNLRDFMDAYINEQKSGQGSNMESFTDDQLIYTIRELFVAGTETLSAVASWMILILLHYPEHFEKVVEEIDSRCGNADRLSMSMMKDMPFTSAVLQETYRFRTPTPASLMHQTVKDAELEGYFIPKGTRVMANLWGVHNDPDTWKDPEKFDPYRHIDQNGKFIASNKIIPFSVGPRFCLGESLARVEVFIFLVKVLKNFELSPDENGLPPLDGVVSIVYSPFDYELRLKERN